MTLSQSTNETILSGEKVFTSVISYNGAVMHTLYYKKWDHDRGTQKTREHTEKTELASQQRAQEDRGHSYRLVTSQFQTSGLPKPKIICTFPVFLSLFVLPALLVLLS